MERTGTPKCDADDKVSDATTGMLLFSGDSVTNQQKVVKEGVVYTVTTLCKMDAKESLPEGLMKNLCWLLVNICRPLTEKTKQSLPHDMCTAIIDNMEHLLTHSNKWVRNSVYYVVCCSLL